MTNSPGSGLLQIPQRAIIATMNVLGIGTDITEVARISDMLNKHGDLFLQRVFTAAEIDYCVPRKAKSQHLAGRFAAKEAVLKALGTGWSQGIHWTDIEVINEPGGKPVVELHNAAASVAAQAGIRQVLISISHVKETAVAFATATG